MNLLICPDSLKLTCSAVKAAAALSQGAHLGAQGQLAIRTLPLSDGGEGFLDALHSVLDLRERIALVPHVDRGEPPRLARWLFDPETGSGYGESAEVVGLDLTTRASPADRTALGIATYLHIMRSAGSRRVVLGIGGTATVDAGLSVACGLGVQFARSGRSQIVHLPSEAASCEGLSLPQRQTSCAIECWVDVETQLLSKSGTGAIERFGPQKGADAPFVNRETSSLAGLLARPEWKLCGANPRDTGSGAGGGISFGIAMAMGISIRPGIRQVCDLVGLDAKIADADMVWTAEGAVDHTTLDGKVVNEVRKLCLRRGTALVVFAGSVDPQVELDWPEVQFVELVSEQRSRAWCMENPEFALANAAKCYLDNRD